MNEDIHLPTKHLDLDRSKLPQIKQADIPNFLKHLDRHGIKYTKHAVDPKKMTATQKNFNMELLHKMIATPHEKLDYKPSFTSSDNHIIDGHHRWLTDLHHKTPHNTITIHQPIHDAIKTMHNYKGSYTKTIHESKHTIKQVLAEFRKSASKPLTDFGWVDHNGQIVWPQAGERAHWQISRRHFPEAADNSTDHALNQGWAKMYQDGETAVVQYKPNKVEYPKKVKYAVHKFLQGTSVPRENIVYVTEDAEFEMIKEGLLLICE
jgi:hypothetical protein